MHNYWSVYWGVNDNPDVCQETDKCPKFESPNCLVYTIYTLSGHIRRCEYLMQCEVVAIISFNNKNSTSDSQDALALIAV